MIRKKCEWCHGLLPEGSHHARKYHAGECADTVWRLHFREWARAHPDYWDKWRAAHPGYSAEKSREWRLAQKKNIDSDDAGQ